MSFFLKIVSCSFRSRFSPTVKLPTKNSETYFSGREIFVEVPHWFWCSRRRQGRCQENSFSSYQVSLQHLLSVEIYDCPSPVTTSIYLLMVCNRFTTMLVRPVATNKRAFYLMNTTQVSKVDAHFAHYVQQMEGNSFGIIVKTSFRWALSCTSWWQVLKLRERLG